MNKYLKTISITFQEAFVYRLNFIMWRVRQVFVFLIPFFMWRAVLAGNQEIYGYTFPSLMTYLFGTTILRSLVMGSRTVDLGWMINSGYLTIPLLKPLSIFTFLFSRDIADKIYNLTFIAIEIPLLLILFKPPVFLQSNPMLILMTTLSVILAIYIYFYINIIFGSIAFWSRDIWASRFLLMVILEFSTGALFPLDMLPEGIGNILYLTPFPYLLFAPLQIYLGQISSYVPIILTQIVWVALLYLASKYVWSVGIRNYEAEGR